MMSSILVSIKYRASAAGIGTAARFSKPRACMCVCVCERATGRHENVDTRGPPKEEDKEKTCRPAGQIYCQKTI